jgi:hypothetical protein
MISNVEQVAARFCAVPLERMAMHYLIALGASNFANSRKVSCALLKSPNILVF